jgi:hypothetical protein
MYNTDYQVPHIPRDYQPIIRSNYRFPIYTEWTPFWWSDWERYNYPSFVAQLLSRADLLEKETVSCCDSDRRTDSLILAERLRNTAKELL